MKVEVGTIVRTVILIVALINQALTITGRSIIPVSDEQITELITYAVTVGASLWAWWKNNSFTQKALKADAYKKGL